MGCFDDRIDFVGSTGRFVRDHFIWRRFVNTAGTFEKSLNTVI
jgi:hypothetical protein